jgi:hypothetical protein
MRAHFPLLEILWPLHRFAAHQSQGTSQLVQYGKMLHTFLAFGATQIRGFAVEPFVLHIII